MEVTGTAQHEAWRWRILPPVERLRAGLRSIPVPIPADPLRSVSTPGHLCFPEEEGRLLFSGDHVLPRISPNLSTNHYGLDDPLRDYLSSLTAVRDLDPVEVLPAHEWRFRGLGDGVDRLTAHHERRLTELLAAICAHPGSTPWDLAAHLTWSRPWEQYERRMRTFPVTGTDAHLRLLAGRGLVVSHGAQVPTWTLAVR